MLDAAIKMQKLLEDQAAADEKETGVYIRPIVLLQAESRNKNDSTTYEKIKQKLIDGGIPAEQIAIKTAEVLLQSTCFLAVQQRNRGQGAGDEGVPGQRFPAWLSEYGN